MIPLPSFAAIRIGALVAVIAGAGVAGWMSRGWKEDAGRLDAERAARTLLVETVEGWAAGAQELDRLRAEAEQQAAEDRRTFNRRLKDAQRQGRRLVGCEPVPHTGGLAGADPAVRFDPAFVGLWNDALAIGLPAPDRPGGDHRPDPAAGVVEPDQILENTADNAEICNGLRERLRAAKRWAEGIGAVR
jgi:hypothetical protein